MAKIKMKKGREANLPTSKTEGVMYFTTDTGKIFVDISATERKQMYSGKLTIGNKVFDGTSDVTVPIYNGTVE